MYLYVLYYRMSRMFFPNGRIQFTTFSLKMGIFGKNIQRNLIFLCKLVVYNYTIIIIIIIITMTLYMYDTFNYCLRLFKINIFGDISFITYGPYQKMNLFKDFLTQTHIVNAHTTHLCINLLNINSVVDKEKSNYPIN